MSKSRNRRSLVVPIRPPEDRRLAYAAAEAFAEAQRYESIGSYGLADETRRLAEGLRSQAEEARREINQGRRAAVKEAKEPNTMARVQGAVETAFPRRPYNVWIDRQGRHVAVSFKDGRLEGVAPTWTAAIESIVNQRKEKSRESRH